MSENVVIKKDRTVTVPASEAKIGVQYDHNVNVITFDCPRYPDDDRNVDMSTMQIYINYMLPDKTLGSYLAENVKVDTNNPDTIHFDWKITRNVTQVKGALQALVCIKKVDAEGNELYHWNTDLIQSFRVGEGMECLETISSDYADVISQLLVNMNTVTGEFEALSADVTARTSEETLQGLVNNAASDEKLRTIVDTYMEEHPVGINVDDTLTVSGDAADAKITGDRISELKSDINNLDLLLSFYKKTGQNSLSVNNYNTILTGIKLRKDVEYKATWTLDTALSEIAYCYITDENDTNLYKGNTRLPAGDLSKTVYFTPTQNYENVIAKFYSAHANPNVSCSFEISTVANTISNVVDIIEDLNLSALKETKRLFPFFIGNLENGQPSTTYKYRISNSQNLKFDEDLIVKLTDGYRCGYFVYQNITDDTSNVWVGWADTLRIPKGTIFRLQLARPNGAETTGGVITDLYDNDIFNRLSIRAVANIETESVAFEYGHNGLKCETFMNYSLWSQGVAKVGDTFVGFNASNDEHTNTSSYTSMFYKNGYEYNARGNHNLGHCASADYCSETDTLIVANGTTSNDILPTVYFISNALNTTYNGEDISVTSDNVMAMTFEGCDGACCVACFGEMRNIMYLMTTENAAQFSNYGKKYLYKLALGMGDIDMTALHPDKSFGTYISGKTNDEYNGTAYIIKEYEAEYFFELQGMKYVNGRIVLSCDCYVDNVLTAYITFIKTREKDNAFFIDECYWIPSLASDGTYTKTESEGVVFDDGYGYVTYNRSAIRDSKTLKFSMFD